MHCACLYMINIRLKTSLNNDVSVITHSNIDSTHSSTKDGWIYILGKGSLNLRGVISALLKTSERD